MRQARLRPARAGALRHRPVLHAARRRGARPRRGDRRRGDRRGRVRPDRLARHSGRQFRPRRAGQGGRAGAAPGLHRPARDHRRRGDVRAPAVHPAQGDLEPRLRHRRRRDRRILSGVDVVPHHRLQGHGAGRPAAALLQGPARPALRDGAGARPSAFRHQHLPVLAARPPLPDGRPQRRDQHPARQRQLDGGAAGERRLRIVRRRHLQAVADLLRRPVRHRLLRQRARVPGARRLLARPRDDDADPGGLGRQPADGRGAARLLRVPRRA